MFEDREDAGLKLCLKLKKFSDKKDCVIVGLTRGGLITAKIIASRLKLKLKALVVKKIGALGNSELALGALVSEKDIFWNRDIVNILKLSPKNKEKLILEKAEEIQKLQSILGIKNTKNDFFGKTVILVDDGVATGASVLAAQKYLKRNKARKITLATPVIAFDTLINIKKYFDDIIFLERPADFYAVGQFYRNFEQISDKETAKIIKI